MFLTPNNQWLEALPPCPFRMDNASEFSITSFGLDVIPGVLGSNGMQPSAKSADQSPTQLHRDKKGSFSPTAYSVR